MGVVEVGVGGGLCFEGKERKGEREREREG